MPYSNYPHSRSRNNQGLEPFLALSTEKQTQNYDTKVLKPPFFPITPKAKGI